MSDLKCCTGCSAYHGGEIKHIKECVFYPESLTKLNEDKINELQSRIKELESAAIDMGEGLGFYANEAHWCGNEAYVWTSIDASDVQDAEMGDDFDVPVVPRIGGKKAREIITKHKDLIESIAKDGI